MSTTKAQRQSTVTTACLIRGYMISKHWHSGAPEYAPLDAPVYRVSSGGTLVTGFDFLDLDTAIEYVVGFVVKSNGYAIKTAMAAKWKEVESDMRYETVQITNDGGIILPNEFLAN